MAYEVQEVVQCSLVHVLFLIVISNYEPKGRNGSATSETDQCTDAYCNKIAVKSHLKFS